MLGRILHDFSGQLGNLFNVKVIESLLAFRIVNVSCSLRVEPLTTHKEKAEVRAHVVKY